jgi:rhodanese-related sulfurtransferase
MKGAKSMKTRKSILFLSGFILLTAVSAMAQQAGIIDAAQVKSWLTGKNKAVVIDSRTPDEYQQAHITGAINIPADQMHKEASKLPAKKTTPIVFYCRGVG